MRVLSGQELTQCSVFNAEIQDVVDQFCKLNPFAQSRDLPTLTQPSELLRKTFVSNNTPFRFA